MERYLTRDDTMPKHVIDFAEVLLISIFLAAGGLGGCAAASKQLAAGKVFRWSIFIAYVILGMFFGALTYGVHHLFGWNHSTDAILISSIVGFAGVLIITGSNISAKFILRKLGIEVNVSIEKVKKGDKQDS